MPRAKSTGRRLINTKRKRKELKCSECQKDVKIKRIKSTAKTRKRR